MNVGMNFIQILYLYLYVSITYNKCHFIARLVPVSVLRCEKGAVPTTQET